MIEQRTPPEVDSASLATGLRNKHKPLLWKALRPLLGPGGTGLPSKGISKAPGVCRCGCGRAPRRRSNRTATRYAWKISSVRARQAEYVLATRQGLIVGAFVADRWLTATERLPVFPGRAGPLRLRGPGSAARDPAAVPRQTGARRLPEAGAANPIKYVWGAGAQTAAE
jgi:hypothetical protein